MQTFIFEKTDSHALYSWHDKWSLNIVAHIVNYRVAQNKPDYLLFLFKFYISTTKHVTMIMYV